MVKNNKTKAFSLIDAIIILSVVAIAIAVATPILTRKIVNIDDIMAFSHGRYEIYYKEIVSFDNSNYYEKAIDNALGNGVTVYERKLDSEYTTEVGSAPKTKNGLKDTLYEEYNNVKTERNSNGDIVKVLINNKYVPAGGRYIVENANVVYKKYDKENHKRLSGELPSDKKIIEGRLTSKYKSDPKLWIIKSTETNNYTGTVISEPFERTISGSSTISENYLKPDKNGNVVGTFDPGDNIKNAVIHAQGGGGAGGGVDKNATGGAKLLNELSPAEIAKIKKQLYENFEKVTPEIYHKGADTVIGTCSKCLDKESVWREFAKDGKKWLLLDTTTGELIGKYDTTNPLSMILPNQVLSYTKQTTTDMSVFDKYTMPVILTYKNIGNTFYTGSSVKSNSPGSDASSIKVTVAPEVDLSCMRTHNGYTGTLDAAAAKSFKCTSWYDALTYEFSSFGGWSYPSRCETNSSDEVNAVYAAKLDYSNDIKSNSWIDKIKFYLDKNEIDLKSSIAHASKAYNECIASGPYTKTISSSCNTYNCTGKTTTCIDDKTSLQCKSGSKTKCNRKAYYYKKTSNNLCYSGTCTAVCNPFYYDCTYPDGYDLGTATSSTCGTSANVSRCPADKDNKQTRKTSHPDIYISGGSGGAAGDRAFVCASPAKGIIAIQDVEQAPRSTNNPAKNQTLTITNANKHNTPLTFDDTYTWGNKGGNARRVLKVFSRENGSLLETHIATSNGGGPGQTYKQDTAVLEITKSPAVSAVLEMYSAIAAKYEGEVDPRHFVNDDWIAQYTSGLSDAEVNDFNYLLDNPNIIDNLQKAIIDLKISAIGDNKMQSNAAFMYNGNTGSTNPDVVSGQLNDKWQVSAEDGTYTYNGSDGTSLVTVNVTPVPYEIVTSDDWVCKLQDNKYKGQNGAKGTKSDDCVNSLGLSQVDDGIYNHIYAWVLPYRTNSIVYSQAGEAGEYKVAKVPRVTGAFNITIGKGGVWSANDEWKNGKTQGPNGGDTIVKMAKSRSASAAFKNVVTAKGGKGGTRTLQSNSYNLCYPSIDNSCKSLDGTSETTCCQNENASRSSADIIETAIKYSAFENIKSLVGQSELVGLGLGRGAEAAGTRAGNETVSEEIKIYNISYAEGCNACHDKRVVYEKGSSSTADNYKNTPIKPSALNFKGGDGAVIITW